MLRITDKVVNELMNAQFDAFTATADFKMYPYVEPSHKFLIEFEVMWLKRRYGTPVAKDEEGCEFGCAD